MSDWSNARFSHKSPTSDELESVLLIHYCENNLAGSNAIYVINIGSPEGMECTEIVKPLN